MKYIAPRVTRLVFFFSSLLQTRLLILKTQPLQIILKSWEVIWTSSRHDWEEKGHKVCAKPSLGIISLWYTADKEGCFPQDELWGAVCLSPRSRARVSSFLISSSHFSFLVLLGRQLRQCLALSGDKPPCSCQKWCRMNGSAGSAVFQLFLLERD